MPGRTNPSAAYESALRSRVSFSRIRPGGVTQPQKEPSAVKRPAEGLCEGLSQKLVENFGCIMSWGA